MVVIAAICGWLYWDWNGTDVARCSRYRTMETAANRLQKEAKGYLDSLRGGCPLLCGLLDLLVQG